MQQQREVQGTTWAIHDRKDAIYAENRPMLIVVEFMVSSMQFMQLEVRAGYHVGEKAAISRPQERLPRIPSIQSRKVSAAGGVHGASQALMRTST